jgi:hypothetical protein
MEGERILPYIPVVDMSSVCRQSLKCDALTFHVIFTFLLLSQKRFFNASVEDWNDVRQLLIHRF